MAPMPPNMPQQAAPGAPKGGRNIPPQFQQHVRDDNPLQDEIMRRMSHLTKQQVAALKAAPQALSVLKQVFPEIGFLFDHLMQPAAGPAMAGAGPAMPEPDADDAAGAPASAADGDEDDAAPMPPQFKRPKTALARV